MGRNRELGPDLRGPLLPESKHDPRGPGVAGLVLGVRQCRARRSPPRDLVAAIEQFRRSRLHSHHSHLALLRAARRVELRPVSVRRLRAEPAAADAAADSRRERSGVCGVFERSSEVFLVRVAERAAGDEVYGGGGHAVDALAGRGVPRREAAAVDLDGGCRDGGGVLRIRGGDPADREGD